MEQRQPERTMEELGCFARPLGRHHVQQWASFVQVTKPNRRLFRALWIKLKKQLRTGSAELKLTRCRLYKAQENSACRCNGILSRKTIFWTNCSFSKRLRLRAMNKPTKPLTKARQKKLEGRGRNL